MHEINEQCVLLTLLTIFSNAQQKEVNSFIITNADIVALLVHQIQNTKIATQ